MSEKIVKVRALAAVDSKGQWCVCGFSGASDVNCVRSATATLDTDHFKKYWVELELDPIENELDFAAIKENS